jgi:transposase
MRGVQGWIAPDWLVAAAVPGVERHPLKKLDPDASALLKLIERWRGEAERRGRRIERVVVAYEAGRDGFWLARWLKERGIEAYVIHPASVAVSRERKRAKTDRLDAAMLLRVLLGWLRGERGHCSMVAIPSMEEEDARRPSRERETLVGERARITNRIKSALNRFGIRTFNPLLRKAAQNLEKLQTAEGCPLPVNTLEEIKRDLARMAVVRAQIAAIEKARVERLKQAPKTGPNLMVQLLARVIGIGIETAEPRHHPRFVFSTPWSYWAVDDRSEVAAIRARPWLQMPRSEWTRRLGALLAKRIPVSWSGSLQIQPKYKCGPRLVARPSQAPLGSNVIAFRARSLPACRRARGGQGQALRVALSRHP